MPLASTSQDDFSAGIYRGRKAPPTAVYDAVNALINDEGLLFRRGGSVNYSTSDASAALAWVYDTYLQAGQRTLAADSGSTYVLDGTTPVAILASGVSTTFARPVGVAGTMMIGTPFGVGVYAGSLKSFLSSYGVGTVSVSNGSKTVTGAGTSWLATLDVGMLLAGHSSGGPIGGSLGVVASIDSDTQVTLRDAWAGTTLSGSAYGFWPMSLSAIASANAHLAAVGVNQRLIVAVGNRAYYTPTSNPFAIADASQDYIELPSSSVIIGAYGLGSTCLLFTTDGLWAVSNMDIEPVDAFGNIQWSQQRINPNLILWGEPGICAYGPQTIVPAVDDVFLLSPDGSIESLSATIRPLYRSYVKAGYQPGLAAVHRGHYILPVLNGTTLVDVLVCRLDRGAAWTRWAGGAAGASYSVRVGSTTRTPKLLGVSGLRVTDLSGVFEPDSGNALDADGTTSDCVVTTRDTASGQQPGFFGRARTRYELVDDGSGGTAAPTVAVAFTSDADAGVFTTLTEKGQQGGGAGWGVSDGSKYQWALVAKRRERGRLRITVTGACASFVLRSVEWLMRPSGKQ